jgi:hypothetical protein
VRAEVEDVRKENQVEKEDLLQVRSWLKLSMKNRENAY